MSAYKVQLRNVVKTFDGHAAVNDLSLHVKSGEFLTLLGPSGCGKTTTLRLIAGFEQPTKGEIFIDGKQMNGIPPYARDVNTVFQSYALFPHMNVYDNIAFGLRMKKMAGREIKRRVLEILELVRLEAFASRRPDQLSGGQKQRVAIARALVNNPQVLLLDEPLGALDLKLRKQMQMELKHLQEELGITFIYVTHDQEEALTMSDRIAVMNAGVVEQIGTPDEIYDKPATRFVADFVGESNLLEGLAVRFDSRYAYMNWCGNMIPVPRAAWMRLNGTVYVSVRPERVKIASSPQHHPFAIPGKLAERVYAGASTKTVVSIGEGQHVVASEATDALLPLTPGQHVFVYWEPEKAMVMSA